MDCSLPASSVHGDFPGKHTGVGAFPALVGRFFTTEPPEKPLPWFLIYTWASQQNLIHGLL